MTAADDEPTAARATGRDDGDAAAARSTEPAEVLPDHVGGDLLQAHGRRRQGRRRHRPRRRAPARPSGSSASPAAASRPPAARCSSCSSPTGGTIEFDGEDITNLDAQADGPAAPRDADDLPGPVLLAEPAAHGRHDHRARRSRSRASSPPGGVEGAVQDLMERVGLNPEHYNRYPQRVLRRPAAAHRHRPRASPCSRKLDRLRRAGVGPRRVDPGAGRQPARGHPGRVRPRLRLHRPRPVGGPAHLRPGRGDVPRQDHGDAPTATTLYARPLHPYTHALLSAVPIPDPEQGARAASGSCSRATCPARSTRRSGCVFRTRCPKAQEQVRRRGAAAGRAGAGPPRWPATSPRSARSGRTLPVPDVPTARSSQG